MRAWRVREVRGWGGSRKDEVSANGSSGWELSETSNSSELPESSDSGEGELEVRGGRKLLRRRRLGKKVCRAVRSTAGRRLAAAQASQAPFWSRAQRGERGVKIWT